MPDKTFKITEINWDTDGESVDLPTEVIYKSDLPSCSEFDNECVVDWLSDEYGWCVNGCMITVVNMFPKMTSEEICLSAMESGMVWADDYVSHEEHERIVGEAINEVKKENEKLHEEAKKIEEAVREVGHVDTISKCNDVWYE